MEPTAQTSTVSRSSLTKLVRFVDGGFSKHGLIANRILTYFRGGGVRTADMYLTGTQSEKGVI